MAEPIKVAIGAEILEIAVPMSLRQLKMCGDAIRKMQDNTEKTIAAAKAAAIAAGNPDPDAAEVAALMRIDVIDTTVLSVRIIAAALIKTRPDLTADKIEDTLTPEQFIPAWEAAAAIRSASWPKAKDTPSKGEAGAPEGAPAA